MAKTGKGKDDLKKQLRNLEQKFMQAERDYWKKEAAGQADTVNKKLQGRKKKAAGKATKVGGGVKGALTGGLKKGKPAKQMLKKKKTKKKVRGTQSTRRGY